jgi:hypothetical protein
MGASRKGYNLFTRFGRKNFRQDIRHIDWHLVVEDTFMPLVCAALGHIVYDAADPYERMNGKAVYACRRCHTYRPEVQPPLL